MKGDISRSTYRAANHYSSVRLQQGRVLLDAEWNEHADIGHHVDRTTTVDVVGPTGAPKHPPTIPGRFHAVHPLLTGRLRSVCGHVNKRWTCFDKLPLSGHSPPDFRDCMRNNPSPFRPDE